MSAASHGGQAEDWEERAAQALEAASLISVGDPEGPEALADAQAAATLALSHRIAAQTELLGGLIAVDPRGPFGSHHTYLRVRNV